MKLFQVIGAAVIGAFSASTAFAALVGVSGPLSSAGTAAEIIAAPTDLLDDLVTNTGMQGFDEQQNVLLTAPLSVDGGTIAAGKRVDSHMIFFNNATTTGLTHFDVEWTFARKILGVMSDSDGNLEAASTPFLGAIGTNYPAAGFANRGLEGFGDGYSFSDNVLTISMQVSQPGDWVRVVTAPVPVPAALPLMAGALGGLGLLRARKAKRAA